MKRKVIKRRSKVTKEKVEVKEEVKPVEEKNDNMINKTGNVKFTEA